MTRTVFLTTLVKKINAANLNFSPMAWEGDRPKFACIPSEQDYFTVTLGEPVSWEYMGDHTAMMDKVISILERDQKRIKAVNLMLACPRPDGWTEWLMVIDYRGHSHLTLGIIQREFGAQVEACS